MRNLRGFWGKVEENDEIDFACNGNDICSTMVDRLQGGRGDAPRPVWVEEMSA